MRSSLKILLSLILVAMFLNSREALALPIDFIYPYRDQIVAPGDHMFVKWAQDRDLSSLGGIVSFSLVPTVRLSGHGFDVALGTASSTATSAYFNVPSDVLVSSQGIDTFQITAKIVNGTIYYSDVFNIRKGVATSTILIDRSKSPFNPKCNVDRSTVSPNSTVIYTPTPPYPNVPEFKYTRFDYRWIGETSFESVGAALLSFIYPGVYTVVLEAKAPNGAIYQVECPSVTVSNNAPPGAGGVGKYLFPFNAPATKSLIPHESRPTLVDAPVGCLNLGQNLSYGYSDATKNKSSGLIYALQEFLGELGFLVVSPTGYFGSMTKQAVQDFQSDNDIEPTGFVGPLTRASIKRLSCSNL